MSVEDERKLFVAGLAETATEQGLRELFESTGGTVDEITVPRDRATGKVRGFAFLTMGSSDQAETARQELDGSLQEGRNISVREFRGDRSAGPAPRPSQAPPDGEESTLYVGNLPFDAQMQDVQDLFAGAGFEDVRRVHLPMDAEGRARGFGFVTLASADDARRAVDEMSGVTLRGRPLSISVARARGKTPGGPRPTRPPPGGAGYVGGGGGGYASGGGGGYAGGGGGGYAGGGGGFTGGSRPPGRPSRPLESSGDTGGGAFHQPPPPNFGDAGGDRGRNNTKWEKKKEKKRKNRLQGDRGGRKRRGGGGDEFRSVRPDDYVDRWDDD